MMPLLELRDLAVHFPVRRPLLERGPRIIRAVDGVSLALEEGRTLAVVGESGSGKSTLARVAARLQAPTTGTVLWRGQDLHALDPAALRRERRELQIIFQDPLGSLDPRQPVGRAIERPLIALRPELGAAERRDRVAAMLAQVGLPPGWTGRYPHELSGGQCQRVAIARAVAVEPALLICDEPVSALDVSIQAQILNLLLHLQQELGMALLFISHNLAVVRRVADEVLVMYRGKVVEQAPADAFYAGPRHPYSQALLAAVPLPDPAAARARRSSRLIDDPAIPDTGCPFRARCPMAAAECAVPPALRKLTPEHIVACHRAG
jgi:oligopeptide/dipeptide ABC transporter ATP-binding protein